MAAVQELLKEARQLDVSSTEGRFRLGDLTEVLRRELPAVDDLDERLALDLELDLDTIVEAWFVAGVPARDSPSRSALGHLCELAVPPCAARAG